MQVGFPTNCPLTQRKHRTAEREESPICNQAALDGKIGKVSALVYVTQLEPCAVSRGFSQTRNSRNFPLSLHPEMLPREPRHLPDYPHFHVAVQHGGSSGTPASRVRSCAHPSFPQDWRRWVAAPPGGEAMPKYDQTNKGAPQSTSPRLSLLRRPLVTKHLPLRLFGNG